MKKKYIILASVLFLLNMPNISADCGLRDMQNFQEIENEYNVTYKKNTSQKSYDVYFTGTNKEMFDYRFAIPKQTNCININSQTLKCENFPSGKHEIYIQSVAGSCQAIFKILTIEVPQYVSYSNDPLCEGLEDFVLCNPDYDKEIDYDTFVSRVNAYKKNQTTIEENNEENNKTNRSEKTLDVIKKYIKDYYLEIIIVTVFIILLLITVMIMVKSMRKSRRLE